MCRRRKGFTYFGFIRIFSESEILRHLKFRLDSNLKFRFDSNLKFRFDSNLKFKLDPNLTFRLNPIKFHLSLELKNSSHVNSGQILISISFNPRVILRNA